MRGHGTRFRSISAGSLRWRYQYPFEAQTEVLLGCKPIPFESSKRRAARGWGKTDRGAGSRPARQSCSVDRKVLQ
jgi:hypothetical protein